MDPCLCSSLFDTVTGEEVAVKKIGNAFDNRIDAKRTLREIKLLRHMDHENVLATTIELDIFTVPCTIRNLFSYPLLFAVYETSAQDCFSVACATEVLCFLVSWCMKFDHLLDLEQVVAITDIIRPPTRENFNDVYIVYELMDTDLHQIIRSNQALTEDHCQVETYTFN